MTKAELDSLSELIRNPERNHRHRVLVIGHCAMERENKALYVTADDRKKGQTENAVWLEVPIDDATWKLNGKTVLVEGVFSMEDRGHLQLYAGGLVDVSLLEEWSGDLNKEKSGR